ncbi:hypothetical protein HRbin19_00067 [bacterium HR19]|nr:hypothetical protein HRbin19_00067 [bacterium HR19]
MKIILLFGIVSLFADITYESARSISGPFLYHLGASAGLVSIIGGIGEFLGYALRLIFGYISDKIRKYWFMTICGYFLGLFSLPFMGFSNSWKFAFFLLMTERFGKALRSPSRDTLISFSAKDLGYGKGFAIHEALDQIGSVAGPFLISFILAKYDYRTSFYTLFIPATISFVFLILARSIYVREIGEPRREDKANSDVPKSEKTKRENHKVKVETGSISYQRSLGSKKVSFILFLIFSSLTLSGVPNFQIISVSFINSGLPDEKIPLIFSLAMIADALSAIPLGILFDKLKNRQNKIFFFSLMPVLAILSLFLIFYFKWNILGTLLWGIYIGMTESSMRSAVAFFTEEENRGLSFGLFHMIFGISGLISGVIFAELYGKSTMLFIPLLLQIGGLAVIVMLYLYTLLSRD